jgi:6-pyruvoyltetrahydropterin/6-carboxytetrahydropterin synthase
MQLAYLQKTDFSAARRLNGQWRGDNFTLQVASSTPIDDLESRIAPLIDLGDQGSTTATLAQTLYAALNTQLGGAGALGSVELAEEAGATVTVSQSQTLITTPATFSAAHRTHAPLLSAGENLALYGKCDNLNGHGHNYVVELTRPSNIDLDSAQLQALLTRLDHKNLSLDIPELRGHNIVTETVAAYIAQHLPQATRVRVYETPDFFADYRAGESDYDLGRIYSFRAAAKEVAGLTGHTYTIRIIVRSPLDPRTETAYDLGLLDGFANGILPSLNDSLLNESLPQNPSPILYNLALYVWEQFQTKLGSSLNSLQVNSSRAKGIWITQ